MSGTNYETECPRCGRNNLDMYEDTKPWDIKTGICLDCGFMIVSDIDVSLEEAEYLRADFEYDFKPFTKKENKRIKEFDRTYRWQKR